MSDDPFAPTGEKRPVKTAYSNPWRVIQPVPDDAPACPVSHYDNGRPAGIWTYRDGEGRLLGHYWRFNLAGDQKSFMPVTFCQNRDTGERAWRFLSWPDPRPLFRLDRLAAHPDAPVLIVEGEKSAEAAERLLPDHVAITSPSGSKSAHKADWAPLKGRTVAIWPDADEDGKGYADKVAVLAVRAKALAVHMIAPPAGVKKGWDIADAEAEGWTAERIKRELFATATLYQAGRKVVVSQGDDEKERRPRLAELAVPLLLDHVKLWLSADGEEAYATFTVRDHSENWPVRSPFFKLWARRLIRLTLDKPVGGHTLDDMVSELEAEALWADERHQVFRRIAMVNGNYYYDIGDPQWRAIEVSAETRDGRYWRIIDSPPCKFLRTKRMEPIAFPEAGGSIDELRQFVNLDEPQFTLFAAWLVGALHPSGDYTILALSGPGGASKTSLMRVAEWLIDPAGRDEPGIPEDYADFMVTAEKNHLAMFGNLSSVAEWASNALCRLSTGGAYEARKLYTDRETIAFNLCRPIIVNGIDSVLERPDLADRTVSLTLKRLERVMTQDEFKEKFFAARPRIMGALFDGVASVLRNRDKMGDENNDLRMATFVKWSVPALEGMGFEPGAMINAYRENREKQSRMAYGSDGVFQRVVDFMKARPDGCDRTTMTQLYNALIGEVKDADDSQKATIKAGRQQCKSPIELGRHLRRIQGLLEERGLYIDFANSHGKYVTIAHGSKKYSNDDDV